MEESERRITKIYLETLSFDELVILADECGVDVPDGLSRSFLIADLLEAAEEDGEDEEMTEVAGEEQEKKTSDSCFPTDVELVSSGPLWALVYWNLGGRDALSCGELFLRINSFDDAKNASQGERFVLNVSREEKERFIMLPRKHKYVQIDLVSPDENGEEGAMKAIPLATSAIFEPPRPSPLLLSYAPKSSLSVVQKLSGMEELIAEHYKNYRYSLNASIFGDCRDVLCTPPSGGSKEAGRA